MSLQQTVFVNEFETKPSIKQYNKKLACIKVLECIKYPLKFFEGSAKTQIDHTRRCCVSILKKKTQLNLNKSPRPKRKNVYVCLNVE